MLATLLLAASLSQEADLFSGNVFIKECRANAANTQGVEAFIDGIRCTKYIDGVVAGLQIGGILCIPTGVTHGQGYAVVLKYLEDHPELLHKNKGILVFEALSKPWACPAKK